MSRKTRLQLFVSDEDARLLKQSAIEEGKSLSNHIVDSAEIFSFQLTDFITCKISYIGEVKAHTQFWRIDVDFIETKSGYSLRSSRYEIWASHDFIADFLKLPPDKSPNKKDIAQFAYQFISRRYIENNNKLPKEYGAYCSRKTGTKFVNHSGTLLSYFEDNSREKNRKVL